MDYRFTAINPKNKTVVINDWSSSYEVMVALPAGSPEGTYNFVVEPVGTMPHPTSSPR